jgi:hypothetical protein
MIDSRSEWILNAYANPRAFTLRSQYSDLDRAAHQILVALKRGPNGKLKIELTTVYQTTK